jgi:hypothetical protein
MLKGVDINVMLILIFLFGASERTCFICNSELMLSKSNFFWVSCDSCLSIVDKNYVSYDVKFIGDYILVAII